MIGSNDRTAYSDLSVMMPESGWTK